MQDERDVKIIRGYYLTGLGQEPMAHYFKLRADQLEYESLQVGDVAVSFYQNGDVITSLPALIRVDSVIDTDRQVADFLEGEEKDHLPMLPIVSLYEDFDPLLFSQLMKSFEGLKAEIKRLTKVTYVQGNLFEVFGEEEL